MEHLVKEISEKHFINDPIKLINGALKSITIANPAVNLDADNKIIFRSRNSSSTGSQVSIVSGGGSGHEPSFAGYVGEGLLSAAVAGTIFASPAAEQIRNCIMRRVDTSKGVLVVIMNYTVCASIYAVFTLDSIKHVELINAIEVVVTDTN